MRQRPRTPSLSANTTPIGQPTAEGRLRGRGLLWARAGFVALFVVVLALNAVTFPAALAQQMTPDAMRVPHQFSAYPAIYISLYLAVVILLNYGSTLAYLALGMLLFWRRADNRMAFFCAVTLVLAGGVSYTNLDGLIGGGPIPGPIGNIPPLVVAIDLLTIAGQVATITFFYIFPSGRFVPRWTQWCVPLALAYWLAAAFVPDLTAGPVGHLTIGLLTTAAIAQVYRYQRVSTPVEREQTKWVVFGIFLAVAIIAVPQISFALLPPALQKAGQNSVVGIVLFGALWEVALTLIPVFIAVAVMRSRLWAIDTVINRTLVYGALTAILAGVYFGCVVGTQALAQTLTGVKSLPPVAVVASTLLLVVLFNPLRHRIQAFIDRRFYRRKYDTAKTLTAFSATLRQEVDLDALCAHVVGVVEETMQPAHVSLWLREPARHHADFTADFT